MPSRVIGFCVALLLATPAAAQAGPRVVALSPTGTGADWAPSLRVELAYVGGELVPGELDEAHLYGPDSTTAVRVAAQVMGADAAVWLGHRRDRVHVVLTRGDDRFAAPLSPHADARTVALVAASLLDEALIQPSRAERAGPFSGAALAQPAPPVEQATDDEARDAATEAETTPDRDGVRLYGGIGTGGLALVSDVAFDPGTLLRAMIGVQAVRNLRVQAILEGGFFRDRVGVNGGGLELQPFGRFCPELVGVLAADRMVDLQLGAHGCVGLAEMREVFVDPFFGASFNENLMVTVAGGGFIAVELRPSERVSVTFRADVDGTEPVQHLEFGGDPNRQPDVIASLSTQVGFW